MSNYNDPVNQTPSPPVAHQWTPPPPTVSPPKPRRWLTILISVAIAAPLGYTIGATADDNKAEIPPNVLPNVVSTPGPSKSVAGKPKTPLFMVEDGTYEVSKNIAAGTYRSGDSASCYWARLKDTSGELEGIITNGWGANQLVTIRKTDKAFETRGCGPWIKQ